MNQAPVLLLDSGTLGRLRKGVPEREPLIDPTPADSFWDTTKRVGPCLLS